MPLTWDTVTVASRVMLRAYPIANGWYGLALLLTPLTELLTVPAYRTADGVLPLHAWAIAFIAVAVIQVLALLVHRRQTYITALGLMVALTGIWFVVLVYGAWRGTNPWTAPPFPLLAACAGYASLRSLAKREV
jgi:hypothetical protein